MPCWQVPDCQASSDSISLMEIIPDKRKVGMHDSVDYDGRGGEASFGSGGVHREYAGVDQPNRACELGGRGPPIWDGGALSYLVGGILRDHGGEMATSQDFATWTRGPLLRPRFLLLCLRAMREDLLGRLAMGSTHKTIFMPDIQSLRIPLPPVDEQDEIVEAVWQEPGSRRSHLGSPDAPDRPPR